MLWLRGFAHESHLRHSFGTRFLATVISDKVMTEKSWDEIHAAIAEDCYSLYFDGIQAARQKIMHWLYSHNPFTCTVASKVGNHKFHFAFTGVKGDWVYLRKAMWLETGFVSLGMSLVQFSSTLPLKISCVNLVCIPEIYASSPHTSYCSPITFSPLAEILSLGMVVLWGSIGSWLMGWHNCATMEVRYGSRTTQNDSGGRYP